MKRRLFLESVVALAAASGASPAILGRASGAGAGVGILIYDARFAPARQWAAAWPAARRFDVGPDAGRLWTTRLAAPVAAGVELTGLTSGADATLLQDLARIHRYRLRTWQPQPPSCDGAAGCAVLVRWILGSMGTCEVRTQPR